MNTPNPFPGESYLNQVQNGTQYPPDSMFAVGKPHGQAANPVPVKPEKKDTFLNSLLTFIAILVGIVVAILSYIEVTNRARRYNALPDDLKDLNGKVKKRCRLWHYPICPTADREIHKAVWCSVAAIFPTLLFGSVIALFISQASAVPMLASLNRGNSTNVGPWEALNGAFILVIFAVTFVLCYYYQYQKASLDKQEHWDEIRKLAKENPLLIVPVTENDCKLLGWNGLEDYKDTCVRGPKTGLCAYMEATFGIQSEKEREILTHVDSIRTTRAGGEDFDIWNRSDEALDKGLRTCLTDSDPLPSPLQAVLLLLKSLRST